MVLNIKDPATDRLARELARVTGESITVAARVALEERLARVRRAQDASTRGQVGEEIIRGGRARRTLDDRPEQEILGYGEDGLPA